MEEQRGRDSEGDDVRERIELAPERPAAVTAAGEVAVDGVQHRRDGDGGEGRVEMVVSGKHERDDAGRKARGRSDVRELEELPHAAAPAVT